MLRYWKTVQVSVVHLFPILKLNFADLRYTYVHVYGGILINEHTAILAHGRLRPPFTAAGWGYFVYLYAIIITNAQNNIRANTLAPHGATAPLSCEHIYQMSNIRVHKPLCVFARTIYCVYLKYANTKGIQLQFSSVRLDKPARAAEIS